MKNHPFKNNYFLTGKNSNEKYFSNCLKLCYSCLNLYLVPFLCEHLNRIFGV